MSDPNRIDPLAPSSTDKPPEVSPTGRPLVPASWVPYVAGLLSLSGGLAAAPQMGLALPGPVVAGSALVSLICTVLLGMSPGLRAKS